MVAGGYVLFHPINALLGISSLLSISFEATEVMIEFDVLLLIVLESNLYVEIVSGVVVQPFSKASITANNSAIDLFFNIFLSPCS